MINKDELIYKLEDERQEAYKIFSETYKSLREQGK